MRKRVKKERPVGTGHEIFCKNLKKFHKKGCICASNVLYYPL